MPDGTITFSPGERKVNGEVRNKRTYALQQAMSALHPIATAKADMPQVIMSALPLKADICGAIPHVCFGPTADI